MKKKFISLLLTMAMCLSLAPGALAAGTTLSLNVSDTAPKVGDTITVTAEISGNPGFSAVQFTLVYDEDVLKCKFADVGTLLKKAFAAANAEGPNGTILAGASSKPITNDGTLGVFEFEVVGEGSTLVRMSDIVLKTADGTDVSFAKGTTKITVGNAAAEQPEEEVTEEEQPVVTGFPDVTGYWETYVNQAVELGLFQGYPDGNFYPSRQVTRGAFVTVLWRMAGKPAPTQETPFTDIGHLSQEFQDAIAWAYQNGYLSGRTATTFAPGDAVTRQAAMKILYYYAGGRSGMEMMFTSTYDAQFTDSGSMPDWARTAMYWGVYNGLISGTSETTLSPTGVATRAQLAKILVNYTEKFGI